MKKYIPNPHFLLVSFFVLIIMSAGSSLRAQEEREIKRTIFINNGDTIINGKKLSEENKEEQARLRRDFKELEKDIKRGTNEETLIIRGGKAKDREPFVRGYGRQPGLIPHNRGFDFRFDMPGDMRVFKFKGDSVMRGGYIDSLMHGFLKIDGLDSNLRKLIITKDRNMKLIDPEGHERFLPRMFLDRDEFPGFENKNTSLNTYNYIDKDGISNRMNIRISEAEKDQNKKISGNETIADPLDVNDLTVFPNFSNGKLGLSFNVDNRGTTRIRIFDSDFKIIFSDDAGNFSGNYIKQIALPKNGIYYFSVSQNNKWFIRKFIKE